MDDVAGSMAVCTSGAGLKNGKFSKYLETAATAPHFRIFILFLC